MQRSTSLILTTHTGSLPRPDDLIRIMYAKEEGVPVDRTALDTSGFKFRVKAALTPGIGARVFLSDRLFLRLEARTTFWQHIHLDLLWPALDQSSVVSVAGTHISVNVKGRAHVYAAPGAMFVNLPTRSGGRTWKVATNYGVGFRLFDFLFPGGRPAEAHVNMAKAWLLSDTRDVVTRRTMDFIGFSVTFKKVK